MPSFKSKLNSERRFESKKLNSEHKFITKITEGFTKFISLELSQIKSSIKPRINDGRNLEEIDNVPITEYENMSLFDFVNSYLHIIVKSISVPVKYSYKQTCKMLIGMKTGFRSKGQIKITSNMRIGIKSLFNKVGSSEKVTMNDGLLYKTTTTKNSFSNLVSFNESLQSKARGTVYDTVKLVVNRNKVITKAKGQCKSTNRISIDDSYITLYECNSLLVWDNVPLSEVDNVSLVNFCYKNTSTWNTLMMSNENWDTVANNYVDWSTVKMNQPKP